MAQDFSLRYPLIDGHGNFGSPDPNDRPAAQRYTEARLAPLAMELLGQGEIDENTVDFGETYDGQHEQPVVLPARFPNLLVNGGGGIAVGMATNIPPHNLREIIDATVHLIDHPDATVEDLMQFVTGPDFPDRRDDPRPGRHRRVLPHRPRLHPHARGRRDRRGRARRQRIVVTEVPYQTSVEVIGQKIAELVNDRRIEGIRDVRNESAGDTVRLVVELKRDANAQVVLNQLYKHTPMQSSFAANVLALVDGVPSLPGLGGGVDALRRRTRGRASSRAGAKFPARQGATGRTCSKAC